MWCLTTFRSERAGDGPLAAQHGCDRSYVKEDDAHGVGTMRVDDVYIDPYRRS